jgi:hypothetical protein
MDETPVIRELLTEREAAGYLAIERETLAALRRRGLGPPFLRLPSLGDADLGAIRYRRPDIETFVAGAMQSGLPIGSLPRRSPIGAKDFR